MSYQKRTSIVYGREEAQDPLTFGTNVAKIYDDKSHKPPKLIKGNLVY